VVLNSTSAGASTINAFAREQRSEDAASEDPGYQVVDAVVSHRRGEQPIGHSGGSRNSRAGYVRRNQEDEKQNIKNARCQDDKSGQHSSSQREVDLEKGEVLDMDAELLRTDSGIPRGQRRGGGEKKDEDMV
jgi:hypothetical protein